jgi:transaldolase
MAPTGNHRLRQLRHAGVSIWLDTLSRDLLESGHLATLVEKFHVSGATSNPSIFAKAIATSDHYDGQLRSLVSDGITAPSELFFATALDDVRRSAAILRPVHEATVGADGFVSFECTPDVADDARATVEQALGLWEALDLSNVMIKVPATRAGVAAVEELTAAGVNVNVTLLFSVERYEEVVDAYLRGLERRLASGSSVESIASVASFFVSRIDAKADAMLATDSPLRGRVAIANAQIAYARQRVRFAGERWEVLRSAGANTQRLLWASTATKDATYSDVLYVERLIAPGTINTMPEATLRAFADHGNVETTLGPDTAEARAVLSSAATQGVDIDAITSALEREGVQAFCDSYRRLLACIDAKSRARSPRRPTRG